MRFASNPISLDTPSAGSNVTDRGALAEPFPLLPEAPAIQSKEADMFQRRTLAHLHEELRSIEVLDRIHDYTTDEDPVGERAFAIRQLRRKQIQDDIVKLSKTGVTAYDWVARAVVFVCAFSYVMLYFLFR